MKERSHRFHNMCGRFLLESDIDDIIASYEYIEKLNNNGKYARGEIFPSDQVPVITQNNELKILKWGFHFKNSSKTVINARSESIFEKPFFKKSLEKHRCIIPANSFYEWKSENTIKTKYKIGIKQSGLFSFAGIYGTFINKDNNTYEAFVIITTSANSEMSLVHSRMPVIFDREAEKIWLQNNADIHELLNMLKPYKDDGLLIVPDNGFTQMSLL